MSDDDDDDDDEKRYRAYARSTDPETSHEAADGISVKVGSIRHNVLEWYGEQTEPWTDIEAAPYLNRRYGQRRDQSWRSRRAELKDDGLIEHAGTWKFIDDNRHRQWRITAAGRAMLRILDEK